MGEGDKEREGISESGEKEPERERGDDREGGREEGEGESDRFRGERLILILGGWKKGGEGGEGGGEEEVGVWFWGGRSALMLGGWKEPEGARGEGEGEV